MRGEFHPWRTALAMTGAALVIALAWALASERALTVFASLARFAVLPLLLPVIHAFVRFLADTARLAWEWHEWRMRPHTPTEPKFTPTQPLATPSTIAYNVLGKAQPDLTRSSAAELHASAWREVCIEFLQVGAGLRNSKGELGDWTIRTMVDAGVVSDPEWRLITSVLVGAGVMTTKGGTQPYPDYRAALAELRHGKPLPCPADPAPHVTRQHTQHMPHTTTHAGEAIA